MSRPVFVAYPAGFDFTTATPGLDQLVHDFRAMSWKGFQAVSVDRATQLARYVPGAKRVVSYMDIRQGVPIAARTTPSSVGTGGYAPSSGGPSAAPSGAPIERQKL